MKNRRTVGTREHRGLTPIKALCLLLTVLAVTSVLSFISPFITEKKTTYLHESGDVWYAGFASVPLTYPADETLYLAGYHTGWEAEGILDEQRVSALWLDTGDRGILLLSVDCIGLLSGTVAEIRKALAPFCGITGCASVQVFSTHTHAGVDTMGMWGPIAVDGKNDTFMDGLILACKQAAQAAYNDRSAGKLYASSITVNDVQEDSRYPYVYDNQIHQVRFVPNDAAQNGIRLVNFAAHAESLRGDNRQISRDYPGVMCDLVSAATGDDVLFIQGAVGGLIKTPEYADCFDETGNFDAVKNRDETGSRLSAAVLSVTAEKELAPDFALSSTTAVVPMDNTLYMYYKFLGIFDANVCRCKSDTGYGVVTEVGALRLDSVTLALLPGEPFPELVSGDALTDDGLLSLRQIAVAYGADHLWACGLCNDSLGYFVTTSTFVLDDKLPYIKRADTDEEDKNLYHHHYEETNSVGDDAASVLAQAFEKVMERMAKN